MGQVLHGSATTTEAIRGTIQHSQESLRALARRYRINPKTVAKWRRRSSVTDLPTGPKDPKSTVLSIEQEAIVIAFRRHTLLPLDDCLYALQPTIPNLTRSSLHRCLQRHGISRLPSLGVCLISARDAAPQDAQPTRPGPNRPRPGLYVTTPDLPIPIGPQPADRTRQTCRLLPARGAGKVP